MREPAFLHKNKKKWEEYEEKLFGNHVEGLNPDRLEELYIQLTDDLAYARTFYPKSKTVKYLNGLAARTYLLIYRNKNSDENRILRFFTKDLPLIYYHSRKFLYIAFGIFTFFFLVGWFMTLKSDETARVVLGDSYVNMTIENIEKGEPGDVYRGGEPLIVFLRIAFNNVGVMLQTFMWGILFGVGTAYYLFINGVMVGAFLAFFHRYGKAMEAWPIIYIHGTLEITAIVLSGAGGFMIGYGILFPGTYKRIHSLRRNAKAGIKMMIGLLPVIITAAFLEGFVTRLTDMNIVFKLLIIISSLAFIVWYYWIYPGLTAKKLGLQDATLDDVI
ncbi:MAG: stage II sporulation protein M [Bacteroidia bacterium]|nr:stage II sporulation protein M [Bacteroidia bacterium]